MRRSVLLFVALAATLLLGASTQAGPMTGASLGFSLGGGESLNFAADSAGLVGSAVNAGQVTMDMGDSFMGSTTVPLDAAPASELEVNIGGNTGGSWLGDPLVGTEVQINGSSIIYGYGGTALITVPFAAGSVGTTDISSMGVTVMVFAQGWTSGTLSITGLGGATPTATAMGSVMEGTPGSVTLVAGARVETSLGDPTFNVLTLTMDFESVPEPTLPLLFAGGAAVLGAFAWRKRQA
jgi:hypothetical protein